MAQSYIYQDDEEKWLRAMGHYREGMTEQETKAAVQRCRWEQEALSKAYSSSVLMVLPLKEVGWEGKHVAVFGPDRQLIDIVTIDPNSFGLKLWEWSKIEEEKAISRKSAIGGGRAKAQERTISGKPGKIAEVDPSKLGF